MAKNNKLINSLNEIARRNRSQNVATAADQMVPQIYAAIAIALHRTYGFGYGSSQQSLSSPGSERTAAMDSIFASSSHLRLFSSSYPLFYHNYPLVVSMEIIYARHLCTT